MPGPILRKCEICSSDFYVYNAWIKKGGGRFCSKECFCEYKKKRTMETITERFWAKVKKNNDGKCWEWLGNIRPDGYGRLSNGNHNNGGGELIASRVAWEIASGTKIPEGLQICHICDNPQCTKNDEIGIYFIDEKEYICYGHLFLGTNEDNHRDKVLKNRARGPSMIGENHWNAKIDKNIVIAIRNDHKNNNTEYKNLAERYKMSVSNIAKIIRKETWKDI